MATHTIGDGVDTSQSTVIVGAGIVGLSTAYYLSESGNTRPDTIHLIESSPELFASASGKAAGFVASDWFGPPTASLGELSFRLHQELALQHDGYTNWGYSRSTGTSFMQGIQSSRSTTGDWLTEGGSRAEVAAVHEYSDGTGPAWLTQRRGDSVTMLSEHGGVAQVDPLRLCQFLLRENLQRGVRLHHPATAVRISQDKAGVMAGVRIQHESGSEHRIPCTRLLLTAGAWTPRVFNTLFPDSKLQIGVSQLAGHSIVVKSPRWTCEHEAKGCDAVFTTMRSGFSPEIFSRLGEEIYVAGLNDASIPLPDHATDAKIDGASIAELTKVSERILGRDGTDVSDLEILREGLCFRPVTRRGIPILSQIAEKELGGVKTKEGIDGGVFLAVGHGPWGISQSLGTGKVMQEMLERQELSADVGALGMQ
jgi:glycine/D-amino acid oxidase-like deaminating enzyme